ncbi:hypothetical protein CO122_01240 [bacterium (Candidatus Gribaldobacteria) CG_4_9_14_3_um_filter_33_9]|nr:MAG: hypothetical protein CO122_01240 [bacterium (Candidatus Gribaldobacteria) CG_4_9_14_3_um_filter_33_9]
MIKDWAKKAMEKMGKLVFRPIILFYCSIVLALSMTKEMVGLVKANKERIFYCLGTALIFLALGFRIGLTRILKLNSFSQGQVLLLLGLIGLGTFLILAGWITSLRENN